MWELKSIAETQLEKERNLVPLNDVWTHDHHIMSSEANIINGEETWRKRKFREATTITKLKNVQILETY